MNLLIKNKKILIFIGIIVAVIFFSNYLFAYDETIVHPTLTEEAAKLYNFNFADNKISDDEIGWIRQGSIDEDKIWGGLKQIRSGNHFYNPFGVKEWKDYNLNEKISAYFSSGIGNGSKQWAHDSVAQSEYVGGDFTWERAIYDYANGDMEHAYKSLGHILHLIEDMSVPAHTRNDFHLSPKELETYQNWLIIKNFVDYEPYETWTGKQAKAGELKFISADSLQRDNKSPIIFSNLDAYFDDMARYSNTNFFSKDTIYSYSEPNTIAFEGNEKIISGKIIDYVYEIDENGQKFKLAKIFEDLKTKQRVYDVSDNTPEIHSDYWSRLAPKSILAGAGIINLFKTEAEKAKKNPDSVQKPPTAVSYYVIDPVSKKVDEVKSSVVAFLNWGKATSIAAYDAVKTTTVTVFNKTKTGLQLTKEYVFTSADSAAAKVGDFFNLTVKSNLEFDKSNPLPAGYSLEDIISQAKAAENIKAAAVAAPIYGAELSAVKNQKTIFAPGEEIALSAKIKNIGAAIWQGEKISLNVYTGEDLAKQFYHSSWLTKVRPARLGKTEINSGAIGIFNFIVTAPIAEGDYFFRARPVWQSDKNEFNWLGDDIASWNIRVEAPPVEVAEKSADLPIDLPVENKEQIFEAEKPEEEILPEEDDLPLDEEIIIVDENIEKEKSEAEALAAAQAAFLEEETARLREEEETAARRRRARAWAAMPPDTEILEFPEDPTFETVADFKFSSTKPNSTFFCSLDSSKFEDCGEITIFEDLNSGEHILKVKAKDEYGNIDETPAEYEWTIKNPPHLVISEILFDAEDLDTGKEFIELYNPTNDPIDLNNWSLYYLKDGSSEIKPLITFDETGDYTIISKNGFFLVGFNNYSENNYLDDDYLDNNRDYIYADARRSASLLNGGVGDAVQKITIILLDNSGQEIDSMNYDKNSIVVAGQSLERKALQSGDCVSSQLKGEFLGNGCDTDDEGDFEIRLAPNPQNSDSVAEPRPTPVHIINGLDYPGIQWAIDIAVAGDEIQVDSGEYAEEIVIDKGIILRGVDTGSGKPIIKEVGSANNITITADGVTIDGFHITGSSNDGITTYYWSDDETANKSSDNTIINNTIAVGSDGIYLYKSHNNKIIGNDISNSDTGMYIDHSDGNIVSDNVMSFNKADGVVFYLAHNNIFSGNIVESNGNQGIEIIKADNNIINKNIIASNSEGIILWNSSDNIVTENMISLNESGIFSFDLSSNKIYHNNFIDNNYQAQSSDYSGVEFFWDNDYPSGGNFWSDYIGVNINSGTSQDEPGGDGIGDTPHILLNFIGKEMIRDRYPLMEEYKAP